MQKTELRESSYTGSQIVARYAQEDDLDLQDDDDEVVTPLDEIDEVLFFVESVKGTSFHPKRSRSLGELTFCTRSLRKRTEPVPTAKECTRGARSWPKFPRTHGAIPITTSTPKERINHFRERNS